MLIATLAFCYLYRRNLLPLPIPRPGMGWGVTSPSIDPESKLALQEAVSRVPRHGVGFEDAQRSGPPEALSRVLIKAVDLGHSGNADAEYLIAWMYESHECIDFESIEFLERFATMCEFNWLEDQRLHLAAQWFQQAAEHGSAQAADELGYMNERGLGVPKDSNKAMQWYSKAADGSDQLALIDLGKMYEHGEGTKQNFAKSIALYEKASNGDYSSQARVSIERVWATSETSPSAEFRRGEKNAFEFVSKYGDYWEAGCVASIYDPNQPGFMYIESARKPKPDPVKALALYRISHSRKTFPTSSREEAMFFGQVDSRIRELEHEDLK